jgi:cell surface protein SprA
VAPVDTTLFYFLRFASDEQGTNYYEYRARMPASSGPINIRWQDVDIALTEMSNLKLNPGFPTVDPILYSVGRGAPGESLIVKGRPSFTRLRRISFGVMNLDATKVYPSGRVWLDEIRATDVARDQGHAGRVNVGGKVANLLT